MNLTNDPGWWAADSEPESCIIPSMQNLNDLFAQNKQWAKGMEESHPGFFRKLAGQQNPEYLWIGCSDSRVPANEIVGLLPGEIFVHRNVANIVVHTDLNCLSVLQYAVEVLKVSHVIVCGHYGCGGVKAALSNTEYGLIDNWLRNIKDIYESNRNSVDSLGSMEERVDLMCELNVMQQVKNLCHTSTVQNAWRDGQSLVVHGLIYGIKDGLIKDLDVSISDPGQIEGSYRFE